MSGSTAIALAGLAVAGLSTIVTPWLTGRLEEKRESRRFLRERIVSDFDELRVLLDHAAEALNAYMFATRSLTGRYTFLDAMDMDVYKPEMDANIDAREAIYALNRKLVIRLGREHPVVTKFGDALKLLDEASMGAARGISGRTHRGEPILPWHIENYAKREQEREERSAEAHERFLDAATALVGSPVEPLR